jgi:hypothetical protein
VLLMRKSDPSRPDSSGRRRLLQEPLYSRPKLMAGLLEADRYCGEKRAIAVAQKLGASGGFFECTMQTNPGALTLQAVYWGEERDRRFSISIEGELLAREQLNGDGPSDFFERDYPIPAALSEGKRMLRIRFEPEPGFSAGPAFGLRIYATATPA